MHRAKRQYWPPSTAISIGARWYDINMKQFTVDPAGGVGSIGLFTDNDNARCSFSDFRFKGTWTRLASINGTTSLETTINEFWSDEPMDNPFFIATPIRITNSMTGQAPVTGFSQGGTTVWTEDLIDATSGNNAAFSPSLRFKVGSTMCLQITGLVTHTSATGALEIDSSTAGVMEPICRDPGSAWSSRFVELTNGTIRVDALFRFKVASDDFTFISVKSINGDLTTDTHSYVSLWYES